MRITQKPGVDRQKRGATQKHIDDAIAYSAREMKKLSEQRRAAGAKPGEGRVGGLHRDVVFAAVQKYGPEVLSAAGQDFFDALKRETPALAADGRVPGRDSANGRGNHFGRSAEKYVGGVWYHWDAATGDWAPGEVVARKGVN